MMNQPIQGTPVWTALNEVPAQYPWLSQDEECEVAIVGGGITGAMLLHRFAKEGIDTILLSDSALGYGSTSVGMGLLEYDAAGSLIECSERIGMDSAIRLYELSAQAIRDVEQLCSVLSDDVGFERKSSLSACCNDECGTDFLREEFLVRKHLGMELELLSGDKAAEFSFACAQGGIFAPSLSAQADPYRLTHALCADAAENGARIFENSGVLEISTDDVRQEHNSLLKCRTHHLVRARKTIITSASVAAPFVGSILRSVTHYSLLSKPLDNFTGWYQQALIRLHSGALHLRATPDQRALITGTPGIGSECCERLARMLSLSSFTERRQDQLLETLRILFPGIRGIQEELRRSDTFAESRDLLPIIGGVSEHPGWYFAVCPGSSAALWSQVAADLLLSLYQGDPSTDLALFDPSRRAASGIRRRC